MIKKGMKKKPNAMRADGTKRNQRKLRRECILNSNQTATSIVTAEVKISTPSTSSGQALSQKTREGWGILEIRLLRGEVLVIAQVDYVLKHGRAGREVCRVQEKCVKGVATSGRTVDGGAALEDAGVVFGVVHADQRSLVVESLAAPVFQVAEEVVQASVSAEVVGDAAPGGNGEGDVLTSGNGHAVVSVGGGAAAQVGRVIQAVGIGPVVREQGNGVRDNGRRGVRCRVDAAGPQRIGHATVVVTLNVDRIFRSYVESALIVVGADGQ